MEKITVKEISEELTTKTNAPFWGVTLTDNRKATVWDRQIAADIGMNINFPVDGVIKAQGFFLNIREYNAERKATLPEVVKPVEPIKQAPLSTGFDTTTIEEIVGMPKPKQEEIKDTDLYSMEAKSSVKLKKNSKGISWEIKVVTGEESLMQGLVDSAVTMHKALNKEYPEVITKA